jgi:adenylate cyclase
MATLLHQLAAIMFTDIVGYTAIMQQDEKKALQVIKRYNESLEKHVTQAGGKVLNYYGDGSLCIFPSATDAVECSLALQQELRSEPVVPLRVGLHIGEVFFEHEKALGDGVNVASRVQSLGLQNTVLLSEEVYDKISNNSAFTVRSLGWFEFKNVRKSVQVFALTNEGLTVPKRSELRGKLADKKINKRNIGIAAMVVLLLLAGGSAVIRYGKWQSGTEVKKIAVLPFESLSPDPGDKYLADGFYVELINLLSLQKELAVISKPSSDYVAQAGMSSREIAKALNVDYLLNGSVRRDGDNLRISTRLEEAGTGKVISTQTLDRKLVDYFNLQTEVATRIIGEVGLLISKGSLLPRTTQNLKAWEQYVESLKFNQTSPGRPGVQLLELAVAEDSLFLEAWFALAEWGFFGSGNWGDSASYYRAMHAKERIEAIDRNGYYAKLSEMLYTYWVLENYNLSIRQADELLEVYPYSHTILRWKSFALRRKGDFQGYIDITLKNMELNPFSHEIKATLASTLQGYGQFRDAERYIMELREESKEFYYILSFNQLLMQGKPECLDSLYNEALKDSSENFRSSHKRKLKQYVDAYSALFERRYSYLLQPWHGMSPMDSSFIYWLMKDTVNTADCFRRYKVYAESRAENSSSRLAYIHQTALKTVAMAALGESGWEEIIFANPEYDKINTPYFRPTYYKEYIRACLMAGDNKKALLVLQQWQQSDAGMNYGFVSYIVPDIYFAKNHPMLDPIRNEPGFEELWEGNVLKLKKIKVPKRR